MPEAGASGKGSGALAPGTGRRATRAASEEQILDAAEQVFAGAGFAGATMAAIAEAAGLPKANVHYYFGSKCDLYRAVLARVLSVWLNPLHGFTAEADPAEVIADYVRTKVRMAFDQPLASKVFANEILHGAPEIADLLSGVLRPLVEEKAAVVERWVAQGRMAPVDSIHLFFTIWAATQTYADFSSQMQAVLGVSTLDRLERQRAEKHVVDLVLRGCGLSRTEESPRLSISGAEVD